LKDKIAQVKERLKGASKEERSEAITQLREQYKSLKEGIKSAFEEKYAQEMDKIKSDPKFKAGKKSKKKSKKKK
jgi:hypothetical protein